MSSITLDAMLTATPNVCGGRVRIEGTRITVHRIAVLYKQGQSPEEIARTYTHLSLGQVYAALAYYHSNRAEIESELAAADTLYDELRREACAAGRRTMSEVRLYMDEDAGEHAVVQGLRARGIDVLTTIEADRCGTTDGEQLAFAVEQGRAIYTFNVGDFARLHRERLQQGVGHSGIIVLPDQRHSVGEKIRRLAAFVSRVTAEEMINRMEYL